MKPTSYFKPTIPATPSDARRLMNGMGDLLDIDLEPMATPRSIPSVTPRELETLRSDLQSQISGLSATLSGKEAEVMALKRSITDAEVRVGNTSEELRNERSARENLEAERAEWDRHRREMENVLREVRQNNMIVERETEKMRKQAEEADKVAEKRLEEQEVKILELEAMLGSSRRHNAASPTKDNASLTTAGMPADIDAAVKDATERVARELHNLYRGKHETKVEALKKSYAARWEKQVKELQENLKSARDEVLKLQTERDATMSGVIPGQSQKMADLVREREQAETERRLTHVRCRGLEEENSAFLAENAKLCSDLERERIEKGELVAQVDLFLAMEADMKRPVTAPTEHSDPHLPGEVPSTPSKEYRTSANGVGGAGGGGTAGRARPLSMLKQPGKSFTGIPAPGESRIGRAPLGRGLSTKGGIMEGIARMGAVGRG